MNAAPTLPRRKARWLPALAAALVALLAAGQALAAGQVAPIPGGDFVPLFGTDPGQDSVRVAPFRLDVEPVTNAEFFAFTLAHTQWTPGKADPATVDAGYLAHWPRDGAWPHPTPEQMLRPVTNVSWFAADAFCRGRGGQLPTVFQWEFAAAASETRRDARKDPAFLDRILAWYGQPFTPETLHAIGEGAPNVYGVRDLHRLVWEWTDDFDSPRFSGAGGRGEGAVGPTCGAGAFGAKGVEDYAAFMRFAMRTSLAASYSSSSLGFRCAYPAGAPR